MKCCSAVRILASTTRGPQRHLFSARLFAAKATNVEQRSTTGVRLRSKVAIVTGAGSSGPGWGTGKAIAVAMAREGARVGLVDLNTSAAEETAAIIRAEGGSCAVLPRCNVAKPSEVHNMIQACQKELGPISVLVNNVGLVCPGDVTNVELDKWDLINEINLIGAFNCTKAVVESILQVGHPGSVINIGSVSGIRVIRSEVAYCCSKAAMHAFTISVAREFAAQRVRCNAVLPGIIETPLVANAFKGDDLEKIMSDRHAMSPTGRMGDAWDIAYASTYLASDEAKYTNGLIMPIDGGLSTQLLPHTSGAPFIRPQSPNVGSSQGFDGKVIFLTKAGSKVGRAVAKAFVAQGAKVFAVDEDLAAAKATSVESGSDNCVAHSCEYSPTAIQATVKRCLEVFGKIDFLFNGPLSESSLGLLDTSVEAFTRAYYEGATGVLLTMRFVIPHMVERGAGAIVNMSSIASHRFLRPEPAHAATAGAVNALTMQTAAEFANRGIRCNAIMPVTLGSLSHEEIDGHATDIAQSVLYLCSEEARYTNGHFLTLDMSVSSRMTVSF